MLLTLALVISVSVVVWRVVKPFDLRRALPLRTLFEPLGSFLVRLILMVMMLSVGVAVFSLLSGTAAPDTLVSMALQLLVMAGLCLLMEPESPEFGKH